MNGPRQLSVTFVPALATNDTPVWWLISHYGETDDYDALALSDTDGDGYAAWEEWRSLTLPTNFTSRFTILGVEHSVPGTVVSWDSELDRTYTVYAAPGLFAAGPTP